jgi:hypothetical protein
MILINNYICGNAMRVNMKEVSQLYHNNFGVAFYWKKDGKVLQNRIQLVFRDTGFYLTPYQLNEFSELINTCKDMRCESCAMKGRCHKFLLKTPTRNRPCGKLHRVYRNKRPCRRCSV